MRTELRDTAYYFLPVVEILEKKGEICMNDLIGKEINMQFTGDIRCLATGKKIKKTFGEGLSYEAWLSSPLATPSIIRPELSRIHEGIALRDFEWENEHHNVPHYVYLSRTSSIKVGVTRQSNIPSRWIDQGAIEAIVFAETPYRQLAGLIEIELKQWITDKTSWQAMILSKISDQTPLALKKEVLSKMMDESYGEFISDNDELTSIAYPIIFQPLKIKNFKFDVPTEFNGLLTGIKGQYLIFNDGTVINIRAHSGLEISFSVPL